MRAKNLLAGLAITAMIAGAASAASAADFSFTGNLSGDDDVLFFNFTVGAPSNVTLRTWSYAGGVNAAGNAIARGGFDPILSLYNVATGNRVGQNDDGSCSEVATDALSGQCYDTFFQANLSAGNYTVAVSEYDNFGPSHIPGIFPGSSFNNFVDFVGSQRDSHWAFDVLNVEAANQGPPPGGGGGGIPEPSGWALMIAGFMSAGALLRRRRMALAKL